MAGSLSPSTSSFPQGAPREGGGGFVVFLAPKEDWLGKELYEVRDLDFELNVKEKSKMLECLEETLKGKKTLENRL